MSNTLRDLIGLLQQHMPRVLVDIVLEYNTWHNLRQKKGLKYKEFRHLLWEETRQKRGTNPYMTLINTQVEQSFVDRYVHFYAMIAVEYGLKMPPLKYCPMFPAISVGKRGRDLRPRRNVQLAAFLWNYAWSKPNTSSFFGGLWGHNLVEVAYWVRNAYMDTHYTTVQLPPPEILDMTTAMYILGPRPTAEKFEELCEYWNINL